MAAIGTGDKAHAACSDNAPASSTTVTCDAIAPNPETDPILAPGSTDVTVNFDAGAELQTTISPAISLGGGSYIDMATGSSIADFDPSTIPLVIGGVIDGNFTGIATRQDLVDLFDDIRTQAPMRATPADATVDLSVTSNAAVQTKIDEITAVVTINKAVIADTAMNAITEYITTGMGPPPSVVVSGSPAPGAPGGPNSIYLDNGQILSGGAAAIRSTAGSALTVGMVNGATIATLTENAPAVLLDGQGALDVWLSDSAINTFFDGSAGISAAADDSALWLRMTGESRIHTAGDNAAAVTGPGGTSVFNLEIDATGATDGLPIIATFGDNAAGISMQGSGGSTATLVLSNAASTLGPAFQTSGDNAPLIDMNLGDNSSLSLTGEAVSFGTFGDNSDVLSLRTGENSDSLVYLLDTTVTSEGANSHALWVDGGVSSIRDTVLISSSFETEGDGSTAIFTRGAFDFSLLAVFMGDVTASTMGNNAPAIATAEAGDEVGSFSNQTIVIQPSSFTTAGDGSPGILFRHLEGTSAEEYTLVGTSISTGGDDSGGVVFQGFAGDASASSTAGSTLMVDTLGARSPGISIGGGYGQNSSLNFDFANNTITTGGPDSGGFEIKSIATDRSITVVRIDNTDITTQGDGSFGLSIGAVDPASVAPGPLPNTASSVTMVLQNNDIETQGGNAPGFFVQSLRPGATVSDQSVLIENTSVTTSGNNSDGFTLGQNLGRGVTADVFINELFLLDITSTTTGDNSDAFVISQYVNLTDDGARVSQLAPDGSVIQGVIDTFDGFSASGTNSRAVQNYGLIDGGADGIVLGDGIQGNFANAGTITAQGPNALVYDIDSLIDDFFELQPGGVVNGNVLAGLGTDTFILGGDGTATFDISLINPGAVSQAGAQYFGFNVLEKQDGSTWTLTGTNDLLEDQPFFVNGGVLNVNASMQSTFFTVNGGTLGGTGTVGSVTVNDGIFAPGNSIGTFTVMGDLVLGADGTLAVEIEAPDQADLVVVGGTTMLDGTLAVTGIGALSAFADSQTYTIIDSAGAVSGAFAEVIDTLPDFEVEVDIIDGDGGVGEDVVLTLIGGGDISDKSIVPNAQQAQVKTGRVFAGTLEDRMAGAGTAQVAILDDGTLNAYAAQRKSLALEALGGIYAADAGFGEMVARPVRTAWFSGLGGFGEADATALAPSYQNDIYGVAAGIDIESRSGAFDWLLGAAAGYTVSDVTSGAGSADVDTVHLGAYGRIDRGPARLSAQLSYGFQSYDFARAIPVGPTAVIATGSADGQLFLAAVKGAYDIAPRFGWNSYHGLRVAQAAALGYVYTRRDGFTETGAGVLNQAYGADVFERGYLRIGLELGAEMALGNGTTLRPHGGLYWEWGFGDDNIIATSTAPAVPGSAFSSPGAIESDGGLIVEAGFALDFSDTISAQTNYEGAFSDTGDSHRFSAGFKLRF